MHRAVRFAVVVGLICASVSARAEQSDAPVVEQSEAIREQFSRATRAMAEGDHARAAAMMREIAEQAPDDELADDALFTAAQLDEGKLGNPARALELYERLLVRFPDSRLSLAAQRRAESIREDLGPQGSGAEALARFNEILQNFPSREERASIAMMEALLAENPHWIGRSRGLLWLGSVHQRGGRLDQSREFYLQAAREAEKLAASDVASDVADDVASEYVFEAYRGAGDVALIQGDYDAAESYYRRMPMNGDVSRERSLADALGDVATHRLRRVIYWVSVIVIIACVIAFLISLRLACQTWAAAGRALVKPPTEVIFMVPIAGLLIGSSFTGHYAIAPAVVIVCIGGVIITWLSGVGLRAAGGRGGGRRLRPLAHAVLASLAIVAVCYIAIHQNRLIDLIVETVRFGPDV